MLQYHRGQRATTRIICYVEWLRGKQELEFAYHIPHITANQGQRSEGLMYVAEMLLYVKMSCFCVTIFKHL